MLHRRPEAVAACRRAASFAGCHGGTRASRRPVGGPIKITVYGSRGNIVGFTRSLADPDLKRRPAAK